MSVIRVIRRYESLNPVILIPGLEPCRYLCKASNVAHEINQKRKIIVNCIDAMANTKSHPLKM